ncbi:hypothetical protein BDA96_04G024600 [Sorghum bicolor]|jgi:hypothetical protein|uniref:Uncharacterized protein n=2 Tax=Sorghum bicolor TaxID=4558 RepID=C5XT40_SORBI|nr:hypothetical protein SORBI_3004G021900 [Sorghum bicolor]KAG0531459.1 hypothetical protein BDA96_04G024600 [Sorghum bicolor]KXG29338.1 hypothetical protein SORBI_3004G022100 [Sorghum bicolor]CAZ96055.1 putative proteinase inhibitor I13, potato inhibitor I [Sorghum bicolor]CAZ96059.1 putative proteinase inhibitor I13, potato inhibitor I [Sorghum bicolor]
MTKTFAPPKDHGEKTKESWPEVKGWPATQAAQTIAHERPDVAVEVLPPGSYVIPGYNGKRVRVHIDDSGNVSEIPKIG